MVFGTMNTKSKTKKFRFRDDAREFVGKLDLKSRFSSVLHPAGMLVKLNRPVNNPGGFLNEDKGQVQSNK